MTEAGKGSKFHFTVELRLNMRPGVRPASEAHAVPRLAPLRVLVAEDNYVNRLLIVRMLEQQGHRVSVAGSGAEAIDVLRREAIDLVLMDLEMPNVGGLEATRLIRAAETRRGGHMPILALTAHAMPRYRERCLEAGMDGYLAKPIQQDDLLRAMAKILPDRPPAPPPALPAPPKREDMLLVLRQMARQDVARIEAHLRRGRLERVRVMAHNLIGAAGMLGMGHAVGVARDLEAAARRGNRPRAQALCRELSTRIAKALGDVPANDAAPGERRLRQEPAMQVHELLRGP
jgi:CheY-like chemotaxis protein